MVGMATIATITTLHKILSEGRRAPVTIATTATQASTTTHSTPLSLSSPSPANTEIKEKDGENIILSYDVYFFDRSMVDEYIKDSVCGFVLSLCVLLLVVKC